MIIISTQYVSTQYVPTYYLSIRCYGYTNKIFYSDYFLSIEETKANRFVLIFAILFNYFSSFKIFSCKLKFFSLFLSKRN